MLAETVPPSLRRRLLWRLVGPITALLCVSGASSYLLALHFANKVYDGWLYDSLKALAIELEKKPNGIELNLSAATRKAFEWDVADLTYFSVHGEKSGLIYGVRGPLAVPEDAQRFSDADLFDAKVDGRAVRVASLVLPIETLGESVSIQVAETKNKRRALAREISLAMLVPQSLLIGLALLLMGRGIAWAMQPLLTIAERLSRQTGSNPRPIDPRDVPEEVRPLTDALNDLLRRLEAVLSAQRKFVADAAHQLRTPLTALKLDIEQACAETRIDAVQADLANARVAVGRMARLTQQLLSLARAEPGAMAQQFQRLDLGELAKAIAAEYVPRALAKNVELSFCASAGPAQILGDPVLLREAANNLMDNALKYGARGGHVQVRVVPGARPELIVEDDGPGIPPEFRASAFERFSRGDRGAGDGAGLGLSIVKEIVSAHRGEVVLEDGIGGRGLAARVVFPPLAEP